MVILKFFPFKFLPTYVVVNANHSNNNCTAITVTFAALEMWKL
jgi:hypothetical protein